MKALFFDLDGTLLDSSKHIPASAKAALREARARGMKVYLASARSPRLGETLGWTAEEFALFDGGIYSNGGYVEAEGQGRYAFIDPHAVAECVAAVHAVPDIHLSLHTPGHGYTLNFPVTATLMKSWGITEENLRPLNEETMSKTAKMLIFRRELVGETELLPSALCEQVLAICEGRARAYVTDGGATMQITSLEAGKLSAIRSVQRQLGLQDEDIAVFGDDINDLEMIRAYPVSVAMGNAVEDVKAAATYVTLKNDEGGIAHALRNILHVI